jgi:hypothetical protein
MRAHRGWTIGLAAGALGVVGILAGALGVRAQGAASSYLPVTEEDFTTVLSRMRAGKAAVMKRQMDRWVRATTCPIDPPPGSP